MAWRMLFFTVNLKDRRRRLLTDHVDALCKATRLTQTRHPFGIDAMVVLPDHIHAVSALPPGNADFSLRWRLINIAFAKAIPKTERRSAVRIAHGDSPQRFALKASDFALLEEDTGAAIRLTNGALLPIYGSGLAP